MDYDLIILGAGPAGMTAGVYAARKLMNTLIVTRDIGGQMLWTKDVENYMGYRYITAQELLAKFNAQVEQFKNIEVSVADPVNRIDRIDGGFKTFMASGTEYTSYTIIMASGKVPRRLDVPGETRLTGRGVAYCSTCDAPLYAGKKVAVAGGGNSAAEATLELSDIAEQVIVVAASKDWVADGVLVEKIKTRKNVVFLPENRMSEIVGNDVVSGIKYRGQDGIEKSVDVEGIFVEIGLIPNGDPVKHLLKLNEDGEIPIDAACRTEIPGLFAAGDVTDIPEKQIIVAAGEGAKAALSAYRYRSRLSE